MMEILKKYGLPTATATVIVLAITFVPIVYQYHYTKQQNARILSLEQRMKAIEEKK